MRALYIIPLFCIQRLCNFMIYIHVYMLLLLLITEEKPFVSGRRRPIPLRNVVPLHSRVERALHLCIPFRPDFLLQNSLIYYSGSLNVRTFAYMTTRRQLKTADLSL